MTKEGEKDDKRTTSAPSALQERTRASQALQQAPSASPLCVWGFKSIPFKPPNYCILSDLAGMQMMRSLDTLFELRGSCLKQDIARWMHRFSLITTVSTVLDGFEKIAVSAFPSSDPEGRLSSLTSVICY